MNSQFFFTTGCANKNIADLTALAERHEAHVADIRLGVDITSSAQPAELRDRLGNRYRRVAQLGDRSTKTGETMVAHLTLGLRIVQSWRTNVILLCECEHLEDCHRKLIADELRRQNYAVEELSSWRVVSPPEKAADKNVQELERSNIRNEAGEQTKIKYAPVRNNASAKTGALRLESGSITLACGSPEDVQARTVEGLIGAGLGIHRDDRDESLHAITHLATGRRICAAATLNQAKVILNQLLRLGVDWSREVPWQTEAEAHRLKEKIKNILLKADKD